MEIPFYIFLIVYAVLFLAMIVYAFFNFYHIFKFGFFDFTGKLNTLLTIGAIIVILFFTIFLLKDIAWMDSFSLWSSQSLDFNYLRS